MTMTTQKVPFQFGTLATRENFIDRVEDRATLKQLLYSHVNTMLVSPRRWGKSSLVKVAMTELQEEHKEVHVCYIDAFSISSEAEFYRVFASQVIACASSKIDRWIADAKKFLTGVVPDCCQRPDKQLHGLRPQICSRGTRQTDDPATSGDIGKG